MAPLGAGGMGEVWRGKDTRLGRDVAIKILPSHLAESAHFKIRFEREAKTISSLNHPNICTLFDVGESVVPSGDARGETLHYLVMELLDGESLAERIAKGPLPLAEVLRYGAQVADALQRAHKQGIVHRDLKPGNIMLTKGGTKLLDFGLARTGDTAPLTGMTTGPTAAWPLTAEGTIVGTFQYMAPEQLEALEADARTDIFALGAVLYEMATGRRAFQGSTKTSLIAAIVSSMPQPISEIVPLTPPALEHVVRKCLAKDPDDRWQSAHDIADQLRWISEAGSGAGVAAPVVERRKAKLHLAWALHAVTAVVAVAATFGAIHAMREKPRMVRSSLLTPDGTTLALESGSMAISPDGAKLAFIARSNAGSSMLWVRSLNALSAQPLAGTEGARFPFWSPDSRFIGFFSDAKLRKIDSSGGPPQAICDAADGRGGSWSLDGKTIPFTPTTRDPIFKVAAAGGTAVAVTTLAQSDISHRFPEFLPDGNSFVYLCETSGDTTNSVDGFAILGSRLDSKERIFVVGSNAQARFSRSGRLLFLRDRTLVAQPFDPKKLSLRGEAVPVAETVARTARYEAMFSIARDGALVFQAGEAGRLAQLLWMDREGKELGSVGKPADYGELALSHDAKRVATAITDPTIQKTDIWVIDIERATSTRLTFDPADEWSPIWSHDDRYVYFTSGRSGHGDVFRKAASGIGIDEPIFATPENDILRDLSTDGRTAVLMTNNQKQKTAWDISTYDLVTRKLTPVAASPFVEVGASMSPDMRAIAYASNESGRQEVYVVSRGEAAGKWQISSDGGGHPSWTKNGSELVFLAANGTLMSVDITLEPEFSAGVPKTLFDPKRRALPGRLVAVTSDGSRFLVNRLLEESEIRSMTLVQNWPSAIE